MSDQIAFEMSTKGSEKIEEAYSRVTKAVGEVSKATAKQAGEQRNLERIASAAARRNETAEQRHKRLIDETNEAFKRTTMSVQTYTKELKTIDDELESKSGRFKQFAEEQDKSFGANAIGNLGRYVVGIASITQAIQLAKSAQEELNKEKERGREFAESGVVGVGQLRQLAFGDQARFDDLTGKARSLVDRGASPDLDQATRDVFALASAGIEHEIDAFADLAKRGVIESIESSAMSVAAQQFAFGKDKAGSASDIIARGLAGSQVAHANLEDIINRSARTAKAAEGLGLSPAENIAVIATLTKGGAPIEQAQTMTQQLFTSMIKQFGTANEELEAMVAGREAVASKIDEVAAKQHSPEHYQRRIEEAELAARRTQRDIADPSTMRGLWGDERADKEKQLNLQLAKNNEALEEARNAPAAFAAELEKARKALVEYDAKIEQQRKKAEQRDFREGDLITKLRKLEELNTSYFDLSQALGGEQEAVKAAGGLLPNIDFVADTIKFIGKQGKDAQTTLRNVAAVTDPTTDAIKSSETEKQRLGLAMEREGALSAIRKAMVESHIQSLDGGLEKVAVRGILGAQQYLKTFGPERIERNLGSREATMIERLWEVGVRSTPEQLDAIKGIRELQKASLEELKRIAENGGGDLVGIRQ